MPAAPESVLFLTYGFSTGGAEMIFVNILNRINRRVIHPVVVTLAPPAALEKRLVGDLDVIRFARTSKLDMAPVRALRNLLAEKSIRKVICLGFTSHFFLHRALAGLETKPEVYISVHTTTPRSLKFAIFGYLSARMIGSNDRLVTVCDNQAEYLSKRHSIPMEQFHTIYNGVDPSYWSRPSPGYDRAVFRSGYGIPADAHVIIKVAAFRKEKQHEDALKALSILRQKTSKASYLLFVGGGEATHEQFIRQKVREYGLHDVVKFCGPQEDVRPFYWGSDLFTLTSVAVETFSMAALEAMSTGLPAVLTDIGGAREMVTDGLNGFTVPPNRPDLLAERWGEILERPDRWPSDRTRHFIEERFSLDRCVRSYMDLLTGAPRPVVTATGGPRG